MFIIDFNHHEFLFYLYFGSNFYPRKKFEKIQLLQIVISWIQGIMINILCYDNLFLASINPNSYILRWVFILLGVIFVSFGVAITMSAELVKQPFEQFVMVLSQRISMKFSVLRSRADMTFIVMSLFLICLGSLDFTTLREGTWASMLLLGNSMVFTFPLVQKISPHYKKYHRN